MHIPDQKLIWWRQKTPPHLDFHYSANKIFTFKSQRLNKGKEMLFVKQSNNQYQPSDQQEPDT